MGVKNNLKLIFSHLKLNIKKEWQYKPSFFMQIIMMILNDAFFIIQWYIIFSLVDNIGGYGFKETMLLWAIAAGGFGVARTFFSGAWKIKDMVYEGRLDVYLTQPKNVLINVATSSTDVSAIGDIIYSFIVLIITGAPWWWFLAIIPAMIIAGLIYTGMYVTYVSLCFHVKNGDAAARASETIFNKAGQYPPAIYSSITKWFLATLVPAFFYTVIPAQYFMISPNIWWILGSIGVTIIWILLAFLSFNTGLKKYNSGSLMGGRM
ncbi:MAG: ABC-2 family transporter protein [Clostridia bacterium]|nr:ABC-2 family transporter protein [Clostridia bacterium]